MGANNGKVHTESKQKISPVYVKKRTAVHETIKCRIEKFESLVNSYDEDDFLCSEEVLTELSPPRAFLTLRVYPGKADSIDLLVSLIIGAVSWDDATSAAFDTLSYHLYLVEGADGKIDSIKRGTSKHRSGNDYNFHRDFQIHYYNAEIEYYRAQRALQADGSLVLAVDVEFICPESALPGYEEQQRWVAKLSEFCGDPTNSDCWIKIGGETLPAHKLFLMACSTAFRTMFTNSASEESKSGVVEIEDFEHPEAMQALIQYCNSGCLDAKMMDGRWSEEIFKLACKYFIDDLKALIERHFIDESLCVENVIDLAILADSHNAGELKAACIQLIAREVKTVFKSDEWKELMEADLMLRAELAEEAASLLATPATPLLQATTKIQGTEEEHAARARELTERYKGLVHTESGRKISNEYVKRDLVDLAIKFRIEEFESLMSSSGEDDCLCSEEASSELAPGVVWKLEVRPNMGANGNISVCLDMTGWMADDRETLEDVYHLYLVGRAGGQIDSIDRGYYEFDSDPPYAEIEHDRVKRALQADGSLVVGACFKFIAPEESTLSGYEYQKRWVANLSEYFADPTTADCWIKIGGMTLPTHKLPLMACSRVLHEKFTDPTTVESKSGIVNVTVSKEPAAMRAILHYCRRGCLDVDTMDGEWSEEIYKLARCYRINDLKAMLEKRYIDTLSVENVVAMAIRADTNFINKLKRACAKFIARKGNTVFERAEWKELEEANATFAAELAAGAATLPAEK